MKIQAEKKRQHSREGGERESEKKKKANF